jgi:pimeloyl-ACP methyl ester carboxylesterase
MFVGQSLGGFDTVDAAIEAADRYVAMYLDGSVAPPQSDADRR